MFKCSRPLAVRSVFCVETRSSLEIDISCMKNITMNIPIHIPACNLSLTETKLYPIVTYLKKNQNVYTVTLYTVYHRNSWQYMYSISMLLICKHLGIMKMFGKFIQVWRGKKSSYCTYSFKSRIFLN